jgi:hypothetical protein
MSQPSAASASTSRRWNSGGTSSLTKVSRVVTRCAIASKSGTIVAVALGHNAQMRQRVYVGRREKRGDRASQPEAAQCNPQIE